MRFTDKVAIVTGAGNGIGLSIAHAFASEGAWVVVADINGASGTKAKAEIKATGGKAISVPVDAVGTDLGSFGHGQNAGELAYLVEAGMTPLQAIHAATQMGASCMGLGSEVGLLKEGMLADLLVVDGDPLQDVRILQDQTRFKVIMKDGDVIKNSLSIDL